MNKKILSALAILLCSTMSAPFYAESASTPLDKYVLNADGTYGYDTDTPIYFYNGSTERVEIPNEYIQPKEQFKATWVATIANLNFATPSSEADFQTQFLERIETIKEWNMNSIIFQIRPLLDAFYPSEINPTSQYLSGTQGVNVDYDPLAWMIETAHQNGLEYHAWFNPYRVTNTKITDTNILSQIGLTVEQASTLTIEEHIQVFNQAGILADSNFAVLHPEMVLRFDEKLFLNPGIPEVIQHVADTIEEVVTNYDIDGIHFDDYFYPYRIGEDYFGSLNEDRETFEISGLTSGYADTIEGLESWRRDNVTGLVRSVKSVITTHNATTNNAVQFGISPFGIWEHHENDSRGSHTPIGSSQTYSRSVYADTYKWIKEETLDYVAPQIYWSFGQAAAPYGELTRWWNDVVEGTNVQVYVGHSQYKHVSNGSWDAEWMNPDEVNNQLRFNQNYSNIKGSILFSYNEIIPSDIASLPENLQGRHQAKNDSHEVLKADTFNVLPLVPAKPWLSPAPVVVPQEVVRTTDKITWIDTENVAARYYVVYEGSESESIDEIIANPANIVAKMLKTAATNYEFAITTPNLKYILTAIDKAAVESLPVEAVEEAVEPTPTEPVEITVDANTVTYEVGQLVTEAQFLEDIKLQTNIPAVVSTNFATAVDLNTKGKYIVKITATPSSRTVIALGSLDVTVIIKERSGEDTAGTNTEKGLVETGENTMEIGIVALAIIALGIFTLKKRSLIK